MSLNLTPKLPNYSLASFDIGTRNLAYCILDSTEQAPCFQIHKWNLISLVSQKGAKKLKCGVNLRRKRKNDPERVCGANATFWKPDFENTGRKNNDLGYCRKHMQNLSEEETAELQRYTTTKNISDLELNFKLIEELEAIPELWTRCHEVIIESQMRANMKKVEFMIFGFLADRIRRIQAGEIEGRLQNVKIVSASHKLNLPLDKMGLSLEDGLALQGGVVDEEHRGRKKKATRKNLAKDHCQILLKKNPHFLGYFQKHSKKDDLADSFLQGLWYLFSRKK